MVKNIIFDLDGTLANTSQDIISSLRFALKKKGFNKIISLREFKKAANKGSINMVKKFLKRNDNKLIKEINFIFLNHYRKNICVKSSLKANVFSFLRTCKKKKIKLYVSTNKSEKNAKLLLKKLKILKFFNFVAGNDTFLYKKPNPLHLNKLKKKLFFKKKETILVGDSEVDSKLAKNFKIKFILIKNGYTTLKPSKINSDFTITSFAQISKILKKLS